MLFLLCLLAIVNAAPVPDGEEVLSWSPAPKTRGTLSIIFSCATALGLCSWTGVHIHLNFDPSRRKAGSKYLVKTVWAVFAVVAPDIVLAVALHQLLVAQEYRRTVNEKTTTRSHQKGGMSLKTAFFTIMGGFSIVVSSPGSKRHRQRGLDFNTMISDDIIDRIYSHPVDQIEDRNKTSSIAKFLACIQVGWILLQCFGRKIEHIYITLLELNTAVHVLIAIVMFGIWWDKPVDINQPIIILDQGGTHDFTSGEYRDSVSQALEMAEYILRRDLVTDVDFKHQEHQDACLTAVICRSIESAPESTAEVVKRIPVYIGKYFTTVLWSDIRDGFITYDRYKSSVETAPAVKQAAIDAAFNVAEETAFDVANKNLYHAIKLLAADGTSDAQLPSDLAIVLDRACKETRMATFKATLKAAFKAATKAATRAATRAALLDISPETLNPELEKLSALRIESFHDIFRVPQGATRSASRRAVRQAALKAALSGETAAAAAGTCLFSFILNHLDDFNVASKDPSSTLQEKDSSAHVTDEVYDQKREIGHVVEAFREAVEDAFRSQYHMSVNIANTGSDVNSTSKLVEQAAFTGIYKAACLAIDRAMSRNVLWSKKIETCSRAKDALRAFHREPIGDYQPRRSCREYLRDLISTPADVVWGQLIDIPDLLWPQAASPGRRDTDVHVFDKPWRRKHRIILVLFASIAGAFYGAVHLTKWNNSVFPTETERLLWRISCCVGMASVLPVTFLFFMRFARSKWLRILCIIICALSWTAFLLARVFIIVESFISLRALPKDAFQTVEWTFAIPHV